ncbi:Ribokinase [Posidoniimonas polymericola]|uniref:Ribokinase n=1 Tax=Posidoniimonas polymericola TaxID=2528002 RepID=A0A5C5Y2M6_9BACT|nr:ribokinase [Posidoniimonas polymericola]TWT67762.1 Ribokinase [Posidoniimonas polymericola]
MANILVVGSINMDVVTPITRMPAAGETLHAGDVDYLPGGKGANAAVAAARLGGEVRLVGCVGDDPFGSNLQDHLRRERIDVSRVRVAPTKTGIAVILLEKDSGQNSILVSPGANALVQAPQDDAWYAWGEVLMLQLECPLSTAVRAAQLARRNGVLVILDPAPACPLLPPELLGEVDVLLPNETELATLARMPAGSLDEITAAAKSLQVSTGVPTIIVTLGPRGALIASDAGQFLAPPAPVVAVDTTAAGDTFAGALAVALAEGLPIYDAVAFATNAGALACTAVGAQSAMPTRAAVLDRLEQLPRREID